MLVYNSSPANPDLAEIARITDYVVGYQCKGNHTWMEEREQIKLLVMSAEDYTGDKSDLRRVAKQVMNSMASRRIISKQEAMVLLADLPLTSCTDVSECVTINNSTALKETGEKNTDKRFVTEYSKRLPDYESMTLYDYFLFTKNDGLQGKRGNKYIIPNFIGYSGVPRFPVTESYARHTIIVYTPWRKYPTNCDWIKEFDVFIKSKNCPKSVRMGYDRVMQRHHCNLDFYEPKSASTDHSGNAIPDDSMDILTLAGLPAGEIGDSDTLLLKSMDRGMHHKWDCDAKVS